MKYYSGSNMPGYMPDSDPAEFDSLEEAFEVMLADATLYNEELNLDDRYTYQQVKEFSSFIDECEKAGTQECSLYVGDYVFWVTTD